MILKHIDDSNRQKHMQVRRGADRAEIYSLAFSSTAQWLAVSSDKGTVHVFGLKVNSGVKGNDASGSASDSSSAVTSSNSSLSFIRGKMPPVDDQPVCYN